jgi:hypothetical protein
VAFSFWIVIVLSVQFLVPHLVPCCSIPNGTHSYLATLPIVLLITKSALCVCPSVPYLAVLIPTFLTRKQATNSQEV